MQVVVIFLSLCLRFNVSLFVCLRTTVYIGGFDEEHELKILSGSLNNPSWFSEITLEFQQDTFPGKNI